MSSVKDPRENHLSKSDELLSLVYDELRSFAARQLARESRDHTLQPTALVHEAWMRLSERNDLEWEDRNHYFRASALVMRRILVDRARARNSIKRGGDLRPDSPTCNGEGPTFIDNHLLVIDECLERMARDNPACAQIVHLKFFAGLSNQETAEVLGAPLRSIERQWAFARAKLFQMVRELDPRIG